MVKAVLFDYGGTLDSDGTPWLERFYPLYRREGIEVSREEFRKAFYASDDELPGRFVLDGMDLERTVSLQVAGVLERLSPEDSGAASAVARAFIEGCRGTLERNRPILERLARRYRLGVVSNFYGNLDAVLEGEGLGGLFGVVADSAKVGSLKPDKGIFEHALSRLGAVPAEGLMVGDSIPRDMRGAERVGMEHAWIAGPADSGREPCCPRVWTLPSLLGLEDRLDAAARPRRPGR